MGFALNYCGVCGDFLGPDDFDGICLECERKICEGCNKIMVEDGEDEHGDAKYRCPFCNPATEFEKRLSIALDAAHDEIVERGDVVGGLLQLSIALDAAHDEIEKLHQQLSDANAKLAAVPVGAINKLIFGNNDDDVFSTKCIASTNAVATWLESVTEVTP